YRYPGSIFLAYRTPAFSRSVYPSFQHNLSQIQTVRHTLAADMEQSDTSVSMISDRLGHSNYNEKSKTACLLIFSYQCDLFMESTNEQRWLEDQRMSLSSFIDEPDVKAWFKANSPLPPKPLTYRLTAQK